MWLCTGNVSQAGCASGGSARLCPRRHVRNGAVISRCSQPEISWWGWRNADDEYLVTSIAKACALNPGARASGAVPHTGSSDGSEPCDTDFGEMTPPALLKGGYHGGAARAVPCPQGRALPHCPGAEPGPCCAVTGYVGGFLGSLTVALGWREATEGHARNSVPVCPCRLVLDSMFRRGECGNPSEAADP